MSPVLVGTAILILFLVLRWAFFVRLSFSHAPFCPHCGEMRGRLVGVGERSGRRYFRCQHCGCEFDQDPPA